MILFQKPKAADISQLQLPLSRAALDAGPFPCCWEGSLGFALPRSRLHEPRGSPSPTRLITGVISAPTAPAEPVYPHPTHQALLCRAVTPPTLPSSGANTKLKEFGCAAGNVWKEKENEKKATSSQHRDSTAKFPTHGYSPCLTASSRATLAPSLVPGQALPQQQ